MILDGIAIIIASIRPEQSRLTSSVRSPLHSFFFVRIYFIRMLRLKLTKSCECVEDLPEGEISFYDTILNVDDDL